MTNLDIIDNKLDVTLYGNIEQVSDTLSKCRLRIFYKGLNRNRTFISDDFAAQLIDSLPYSPVKGIFSSEDMDFGEHGEKNSDGQIYGVVPESPNFKWEKHLDEDGIEREYACADVILFTALYPEAKLIVGKSQSMEIYRKGLDGEWQIWPEDGKPYFKFTKGRLIGLQVLGDDIEPCFEGSAFFSLYQNAKEIYDYIKKSKEQEESKRMDKNTFRLSDSEKYDILWDAISKEYTDAWIHSVYDDYAIFYNFADKSYYRAYYTKNDSDNTVAVNNVEKCFIVDVTETEYTALEALKAVGTYSEIQDKLTDNANMIDEFKLTEEALRKTIQELNAELDTYKSNAEKPTEELMSQIEEYKASIAGMDADITKLTEKVAEYEMSISEKDEEIVRLNQVKTDIENEKSELEEFKLSVENEQKEAIINEFASHLTESQITDFKEKMSTFSIEDFRKEVCYAAYNTDTSIISDKKEEPDLIFKNTEKNTNSGVMRLLSKYKGGNR